jgi:hypothetical protein
VREYDFGVGVGVRVPIGPRIFSTSSRLAQEPTKAPIQWSLEALSVGVKGPGREADHSFPTGAGVKNAWNCTSSPPYVFMAWCLTAHRDNFAVAIRVLTLRTASGWLATGGTSSRLLGTEPSSRVGLLGRVATAIYIHSREELGQ